MLSYTKTCAEYTRKDKQHCNFPSADTHLNAWHSSITEVLRRTPQHLAQHHFRSNGTNMSTQFFSGAKRDTQIATMHMAHIVRKTLFRRTHIACRRWLQIRGSYVECALLSRVVLWSTLLSKLLYCPACHKILWFHCLSPGTWWEGPSSAVCDWIKFRIVSEL